MDSILGNDQSKKYSSINTKNTFVWIQLNVVMATFEKDDSQMVNMMLSMLQMGKQVIEVWFHNMFNIMERIRHGAFNCSTSVFNTKRKLFVGKGIPWENEGSIMLIGREYLYLIVAKKTIHK